MAELLNPYIAGAPVTEARMFFGREDVFTWIERSLSGQYADHILVLHGQRRVGKTSVLKQLPHHLPERYIPVFFDLQGRTHTSLDRFLWWLAREIVRVLKQDRGISADIPDREAFTQDPEYLETQFLPALRPHLGGCNLLLTFDEFDTLQEPEIRGTLGQALVEILRRLMGREGFNFIYSIGSSGRKLENMQASYTEFFKAALYKKVSFLGREDSLRLITLPVEGVLEYEAKAAERIVRITSGHPYFTQLLCHELFSQCQKTGARGITEADVEAVLEDVVERGTVNLKFVWDEAADLEKWILAGLAQPGTSLDLRALSETLRRQRVRFADRDLESALLHLREKDVLTSENDFIIHLMRLWLQKNRPLEQVREELVERNPIASRYLEIGLEYLDTGLEEKALESFHQVLAIDPHNLAAHVRIAEVHLRQQRHAEAVAEFEKAMAIDDEDVAARTGMCEARLALGDQALARGRAKEAAAVYQQVLAINPEHGEARQRMADLARQAAEKSLADGRDEDALASFVEAIGYTPEDQALEARYRDVREEKKAKILAGLKATASRETSARSWEKAARALEQALELAPEDPGLTELLRATRASQRADRLQSLPEKARSLAASERWDEASAAWQEYLSLEPSDPELAQAEIERLKEAQGLAQTYAEAQAALSRKDYDQAISILKGIVARDETYKESTRLLLQAIEARRRARPKFRIKWKGVRLSRKARLALIGGLAAVALGAAIFAAWDPFTGPRIRGLGTPAPLAASDVKVCLLTEADGIADAYYAPIWRGIEAAQTTYGIEGAYVEGTDETNVDEQIKAFLGEGCDLLVSGWPFADAMQAAAVDHPEVAFLVLDASYDPAVPNLMGVDFKTWEVSFLAGYLAAGMTETGRVGTFGGADIAPVTETMDAFARGVEYYNQVHSTEVVVLGRNPTFQTGLFSGTFVDAEPTRALTEDLLDQGADILFPVTGPAITAAAEATRLRERAYVIGIDVDWVEAYPRYTDVFLSSAQKGLEEMVTEVIRRLVEGEFPGDPLTGNLQNGGVLLAPFPKMDSDVPAELAAELEALQQDAPALSDPRAARYSFPFDTITAIADFPSNPDLLYLGTAHAGVYRSDDGGQTWQPSRSGLGGGAITSLAAQDANLLLASSGLVGPYRSTDGGDTWQPIHQGIDVESLIGWGSTVVADPYRYPAFWFSDGGSVYETTDRGDTWIERTTQDFQLTNLVASPSEANTLYASSSNEASGEGPSVHVSRDGGQTWTRLLELDAEQIKPGQLAVDSAEGIRLYVSTDSAELGTYASSDGGATWQQVAGFRCDYLSADPRSPGSAYCVRGASVLGTQDSGETWAPLSDQELPSPINVPVGASRGSGAYYAATVDGLFVSTDQGVIWTEQSNGLPLVLLDLSMLTGSGPRLYASDGTGQVARAGVNAFDWEEVSSPNHTSWVIGGNGETVYATDANRVYLSSDAGSSWRARSSPSSNIARLAIHPTLDGWLYALFDDGQPAYRSTDGGGTWEATAGMDSITDARLTFSVDGETVYAAGYDEIYRSDDAGWSWTACPPSGAVASWADSRALVDPDSADRLLVATRGGGILISEDGCMSWGASNDGLPTLFVNTLAVDPSRPNTFYAATDAGAYVSEDDGASWALISGWLPEDSLVYSLVVDPRFPGVLYAATPEGVFRWELAPTPVPALPSWESDLRALADPILESVTSRTPVFEYDFSSVSPASTSFLGAPTIAGGVFQCQVQGDEACGFSWEGGTSDFVAEYEFTYMTPSSPALVSLKFRASEDQSLQFWMSLLPSPTTGAWWILREDYEAGNIGPNVGEGTSEAVGLGPQTRVTVIALGSQVAVLLNGEPLAFYAGSSVRGQSYELRLEAAQQNAEVHFDNVRFWDIRDYTAPPPTATAATPPPTVTAAESWVTDFAEPILQAIEGRTPVFEDDFSTCDEDWVPWPQEGADCIDGAMRFTVTSGNLSLGRPREIAHFVFQFDIIPRRLNVSDEVGSIFRHGGTEDSESWEAFMISPGGGTSGGDRWSWIRDPGASGEPIVLESGELPILHFSEPTRVTVIASRDEAAVYLNGQPVAYRDDSTMRGEWHTLFLSSVSGVSEVEFDNVRFWDITDLTIP